jgi:hypothetical protein
MDVPALAVQTDGCNDPMAAINEVMNGWVTALLVVKFDEKHGQQVQSIYPPNVIPMSMLNDIKMLSMPDCMEPGARHEFQFMVRVRNKDIGANPHLPLFLNCFASFRQCPDPTTKRGYFQQSVVLVSKLPHENLFYNILTRLAGVLADIPGFEEMLIAKRAASEGSEPESPSSSAARSKVAIDPSSGILDSTLEVGFQHFMQWPAPVEGKSFRLPFYGNIIPFYVPPLPAYYTNDMTNKTPYGSGSNICPAKSLSELLRQGGLDGGGFGLFHSVSIVGILSRVGLLPHIWTLWELLMSGHDVIVWSPCAAVSSSVVTALISLFAPFVYGGDFRPYLNPYDSDVNLLANACRDKYVRSQTCYTSCMGGGSSSSSSSNNDNSTDYSYYITNFLLGDFASAFANEDADDDDVGTANQWIWSDDHLEVDNVLWTDSYNQVDRRIEEQSSSLEGSSNLLQSVATFMVPKAAASASAGSSSSSSSVSMSYGDKLMQSPPHRQNNNHRDERYIRSIGSPRNKSNASNNNGRLPGMILGITNPFLLKSFAHAHCAILLPNPELDRTKKKSGGSASGSNILVSSFTNHNISGSGNSGSEGRRGSGSALSLSSSFTSMSALLNWSTASNSSPNKATSGSPSPPASSSYLGSMFSGFSMTPTPMPEGPASAATETAPDSPHRR